MDGGRVQKEDVSSERPTVPYAHCRAPQRVRNTPQASKVSSHTVAVAAYEGQVKAELVHEPLHIWAGVLAKHLFAGLQKVQK